MRVGDPQPALPANWAVYVVSMRGRTDRQDFMRQQLKDLPAIFSFDADRDYDGRGGTGDWGAYTLFPWQINSPNPWWNRPLRAGEVGCFLAHAGCWTHAARAGVEVAVVLEDDALLARDGWRAVVDAIGELQFAAPHWDLLYVGRSAKGPDGAAHGRFVVPGYSWLTHAYALSAAGVGKLLACEPRARVMPLDEFLSATFIRHPRADIAAALQPSLNAFALSPPLVPQAPEVFFGSDTEISPFLETP